MQQLAIDVIDVQGAELADPEAVWRNSWRMQKSRELPPLAESSLVYSSGQRDPPLLLALRSGHFNGGGVGSSFLLTRKRNSSRIAARRLAPVTPVEPASGERDQVLLDVFLLDFVGPEAGRVARGEIGEELAERCRVGADGLGWRCGLLGS